MSTSISVLWPNSVAPDIEEVKFSYEFCKRISQDLCQTLVQEGSWINHPPNWSLAHVLSATQSQMLLVVNEPELVISSIALNRLKDRLDNGYMVCGPVYNVSSFFSQEVNLPFPYVDITTFLEVSQNLVKSKKNHISIVQSLDPACILYQREFLEHADATCLLSEVHKSIPEIRKNNSVVDSGSLVHIFRYCYEDETDNRAVATQMARCAIDRGLNFLKDIAIKHLIPNTSKFAFEIAFIKKTLGILNLLGEQNDWQRDFMVHLIPKKVKNVLDIGCAGGKYGKRLKMLRSDIFLKGIEKNQILANSARIHYDEVINCSIESADLKSGFELINCGDVLEHLHNPWEILRRFHGLLKQSGYLVMSIPNMGHWSIVRDLVDGKFQYVPVGLLSVSHVRWFTESSIREMLLDVGFEIEIFYRWKISPTPEGLAFIHHICENGYGNENSLLTNEFVIRAIKE